MSLPTPHLDDRRFQDIVDEAKRLIPRYCPAWTDHNLSDPGIALIELFAWMTEMTLYRVNQVPEKHYMKFLELMGIQRFPGAAARADIAFWLSAPQPEAVVVPARTQVGTVRTEHQESVVFTTDEPVRIVAPVLTNCLTSTQGERLEDRWDDLRAPGIAVDCFPSILPEDAVYLGFAEGLAGNIICLTLQSSLEGRGVDPNRPPWVWEAWGGESWVPARLLRDETGGLNRDGRLVLICPKWHEPMTVGSVRSHWIRCRMTVAAPDQPTYQASPKIWALSASSLGGIAPAHHADMVTGEWLGRSDGRPGQKFTVMRTPVLPRADDEAIVVTSAEGVERWKEVDDFSGSGPDDRHFTWDSSTGEISFGMNVRAPDGSARQYGAIPALDGQVSVSRYRHGGGSVGNVGRKTLCVLKSSIPFIGRVENLDPAAGGVDPETIENLRMRGPMSLRTGRRAVTCDDFERLTVEASTMVARARCLPPAKTGEPIRVLIVPRVAVAAQNLALGDLGLGDDLVERVAAYLDERRTLSTMVTIGPPYYQGVTVVARANALPGVPAEIVRDRALTALYEYINPLTGGPEGNGWPFGRELNVGEAFALLAGVEGVASVQGVELFPSDLVTSESGRQARQSLRLPPDTLFASFRHQVQVS
jgi:predicted phage baseplate assembly protein